MDTLIVICSVIIIISVPTLIILSFTPNLSSTKLMLLGIEVTLLGAVFIGYLSEYTFVFYYLGLALLIIGATFNIYGFYKK
ncbi:hypothetical protein [Clostridium culturomicium]|uniref:hypothetical protein n=1 Tax=Clostridium culturomicium TaxID=1499683 RepID=UPI003857C858